MSNIYQEIKRLAALTFVVKEWVEPAVKAQRRAVCNTCPWRDAENDECTVCGCLLDLKTESKINWVKGTLRNEVTHCPLGKWGDLEITNEYRRMAGKPPLPYPQP